jgi:hypothetical protein
VTRALPIQGACAVPVPGAGLCGERALPIQGAHTGGRLGRALSVQGARMGSGPCPYAEKVLPVRGVGLAHTGSWPYSYGGAGRAQPYPYGERALP